MPKKIKSFLSKFIDYWGVQLLKNDDLINIENLRTLTSDQLQNIFNSQDIEDDWRSLANEREKFQLPELTGGVNPGDQKAIFFLVKYFGATKVLEIGTHIGCSTVNIALAINFNPNKNEKKMITLDILDVNDEQKKPWLKYNSKYSPVELIKLAQCDSFTHFYVQNSIDYLKNCNVKFDLIFLDGSHKSNIVFAEIPLALKLLNPNGVILLHDYYPDALPLWENGQVIYGPYYAINKISKKTKIRILPLGRLPWKTKYESNYTSLAILTKYN